MAIGAWGENRSLEEAPYHLFGTEDYLVLESLLDLIPYFMWDAILIDDRNGIAFQFSHNEWLAVASDSNESVNAICQRLELFQLEPHPHEEYEGESPDPAG